MSHLPLVASLHHVSHESCIQLPFLPLVFVHSFLLVFYSMAFVKKSELGPFWKMGIDRKETVVNNIYLK